MRRRGHVRRLLADTASDLLRMPDPGLPAHQAALRKADLAVTGSLAYAAFVASHPTDGAIVAAMRPGGTVAERNAAAARVLDRAYAPACPGARPGGLQPWEVRRAAWLCGRHPKVKALDLVEVDPTQDVADVTVLTTGACLLSFAAGVVKRLEAMPAV